MYSGEELAVAIEAAREGSPYFRGLDWNNAEDKWGHVATPWRDLYPGCWEILAEVTTHPTTVCRGFRQVFPTAFWEG